MTVHTPIKNFQLKKTILRGIYDNNIMLENKQHEYKSNKRLVPKKHLVLLTFMFFFSVMIVYGVFSKPVQKNLSQESYVMRASNDDIKLHSIIPALEAPLPTRVSYILRSPEPFLNNPLNQEEFQDYSFILNDDEVRLGPVLGLDVHTIVIDPGHGGRDSGAMGALKTKEKDIVMDIARRLQKNLQRKGNYNVLLTRKDDYYMSLAERVKFANDNRADLFISLHINALPQKDYNVIETYQYGPPSDSKTINLARFENKNSGFLVKDFETIFKKIGDKYKEQESSNLASSIQHHLYTNIKQHNDNIHNGGVKIAPFVVILGVDAPAVLVEISCISNEEEELNLRTSAYRNKITNFLSIGAIRYLENRNTQISKGETNDQKVRQSKS